MRSVLVSGLFVSGVESFLERTRAASNYGDACWDPLKPLIEKTVVTTENTTFDGTTTQFERKYVAGNLSSFFAHKQSKYCTRLFNVQVDGKSCKEAGGTFAAFEHDKTAQTSNFFTARFSAGGTNSKTIATVFDSMCTAASPLFARGGVVKDMLDALSGDAKPEATMSADQCGYFQKADTAEFAIESFSKTKTQASKEDVAIVYAFLSSLDQANPMVASLFNRCETIVPNLDWNQRCMKNFVKLGSQGSATNATPPANKDELTTALKDSAEGPKRCRSLCSLKGDGSWDCDKSPFAVDSDSSCAGMTVTSGWKDADLLKAIKDVCPNTLKDAEGADLKKCQADLADARKKGGKNGGPAGTPTDPEDENVSSSGAKKKPETAPAAPAA